MKNDEAMLLTLLTDQTTDTNESHITTSRGSESKTLLPPSANARMHTAASDSTTIAKTSESEADTALSKPPDKRRNHPTRIFTRTTRKTKDDSAGTNTSAAASATHTPSAVNQPTREVTAGSSNNSGKQHTPRLPATTVPGKTSQSTQVVNDMPNQSIDNFKDWYTILKILAHQKRGSRMFYKVLWEDLFTSCIKEDYVTALAKDRYWLDRHERTKTKKRNVKTRRDDNKL